MCLYNTKYLMNIYYNESSNYICHESQFSRMYNYKLSLFY